MLETAPLTVQIRPVECFKEGWNLIKQDYLLFFGISAVGIYLGNLSLLILTGSMISGIHYCFLAKIDGQRVEFEDLLKGFRFFWPSLGLMAVIVLPMLLVLAAVTIPFLTSLVQNPNLGEKELYARLLTAFAVEVVLATLMTCFHTLLVFSFPLLVDRKLSAWQAILVSVKAVWKNLSAIAGLFGVGFLVSLAGMLFFCVGIYFVIPLIIAANVVAYRRLFPAETARLTAAAPDFYERI